jgi:hypothetical protein
VRDSQQLDGTEVVLVGEAIGEALRAGSGGRWVNLLGGGAGVGVVMSDDDADSIERFGDHNGTGDTVQVSGVMNRACSEHGGELDVHAAEVEFVSRGTETENVPDRWKLTLGLALALVAVVEYRLYRFLREHLA